MVWQKLRNLAAWLSENAITDTCQIDKLFPPLQEPTQSIFRSQIRLFRHLQESTHVANEFNLRWFVLYLWLPSVCSRCAAEAANRAKCCSFSAVAAPIFANQYAFRSISELNFGNFVCKI